MMFTGSLVIGACSFALLALEYMTQAPKLEDDFVYKQCILFKRLCDYFEFNGWVLIMILWTSFNVFWVSFLFIAHVYQICVNLTTNEMSNHWKYDYFSRKGDSSFYNPFDVGFIGNFYQFINDSEIWSRIYVESDGDLWISRSRVRKRKGYEMV